MSGGPSRKDHFTQLFEQYFRPLYAFVYRKTRDSFLAEEIAQHTFIKYWQQKGDNVSDTPQYLLFIIAKGLLIDHWRKKDIMVPMGEEGAMTDAWHEQPALEDKYSALHFDNMVKAAATTLPERQKQIFEMNYYQEMKGDEIAAALNISPKTVSNLLTRARRHIRSKVSSNFFTIFTTLL